MEAFKGAGINPLSYIHYTEHLAPFCTIMNIPLILSEREHEEFAKKYYPDLSVHFVPYEDCTPEFLVENYNVMFRSDIWDKKDLQARFNDLASSKGKTMRSVHCPHGFSDKAFWFRLVAKEDITLIYGQNMLDMLEEEGVRDQLSDYVITGNYRYAYYKKHRAILDKIVQEEVFSQFQNPERPTLLYAPTWQDAEQSTSFFDSAEFLMGELPLQYNLLVKLHPHLEDHDIVEYYRIISQYNEFPNIVFLEQYPLIFPLLARCEAYIGDMSSIGYDYLAFNRPMIFLNQNDRDSATDRGLYLFRCGIEVKRKGYSDLYPIIFDALSDDNEKLAKKRQETWDYSFGPEKPFEEIRKEVIHACGMLG